MKGDEGGLDWYIEVLNVTNQKNTLVVDPGIVFERGLPGIEEEHIHSIPLLPTFGVRFRF